MSDNEYAKVIAKNLKRIAADHEKTQADIARDLRINQKTVSSWMVGTRIPRMDKIDMLCNYFNVNRAEIMEAEPTGHRETVSADERELLRLFRKLNATGQSEAMKRIFELIQLGYTQDASKDERAG